MLITLDLCALNPTNDEISVMMLKIRTGLNSYISGK
jgi:hypothetical protein